MHHMNFEQPDQKLGVHYYENATEIFLINII